MFAPISFENMTIPTEGLTFWYDVNDKTSYPSTGTTIRDISNKNHNGTLYNGPTFNSANGGSLVFDGADDYVESINPDNLGIGVGYGSSYFVAYKPTEAVGRLGTLFGCFNCVDTCYAVEFSHFTGQGPGKRRLVCYSWDNTANIGGVDWRIPSVANQWNFITFVLAPDGTARGTLNGSLTSGEFYVNGVNFITSSGASPNFNRWINRKGDINMGGGGNYGADSVEIAAAGVYNRALTNNETSQLYNYYRIRYNI